MLFACHSERSEESRSEIMALRDSSLPPARRNDIWTGFQQPGWKAQRSRLQIELYCDRRHYLNRLAVEQCGLVPKLFHRIQCRLGQVRIG